MYNSIINNPYYKEIRAAEDGGMLPGTARIVKVKEGQLILAKLSYCEWFTHIILDDGRKSREAWYESEPRRVGSTSRKT